MAQITHGVRAILSHPLIYSSFQSLMGAHQARRNFVANFIKPFPGMKMLDIGCGPADILAHLPDIEYCGFDISEDYISQARKKFGNRGEFHCKQLEKTDLDGLPPFDVVLTLGLLHHLDDEVATSVMQLASKVLKPGGRLLTFDPCLDSSQSPIASFLVRNDRGRNVRDKKGYEALTRGLFPDVVVTVRHDLIRLPYTHIIMECRK